ncbi:MAG TPA: hypothetical protein VIU39_01650 [Anaerolineales bacterium]
MLEEDEAVRSLKDTLLDELARALALPRAGGARQVVRLLFARAAGRFAQLGVDLDRVVAEQGTAAGARWALPHFARAWEARGAPNIPAEGPLVIASNHPGSFDSLVITAHISRPDYKVIIGDIPFFEKLPHLSEHAIYAPGKQDVQGRMQVIRRGIRHLASGGALLIFARGGIEPDPAFMPAPGAEFNLWSRSLQIFLDRVPQTRVLVTIVSGVLSRAAMRHPITWLRTNRPDRQRLAFMVQMAQQVLTGREKYGLVPRVSFGPLIGPSTGDEAHHSLQCITDSARSLLQSHLLWQQENRHAPLP